MRYALIFLLLCGTAEPTRAAPPVIDDAGHALTLGKPVARVISLAPSATELLYEAGGGDRLVGTVDYSDHPPAALAVPRVGSNQTLDIERIATLKPDLLLVWFHGNASHEVDKLGALGIPMFYVEPRRIVDVPGVLERLGQVMGTEKAATAAADRFRARHAALRARYAGSAPVRVFYQVAERPLLTINDRQIIADVIRLCGGRNVFGGEPVLVPQLSTESVVAANPEVIITAMLASKDRSPTGPVREPKNPSLALWARFSNMKAVKHGQLWLVPGDPISRHGPRILDGAEAICTVLDEARKAGR